MWQVRRLPEVNTWMTADDSDPDSFAERFADPDRLAVTLVVEKDGEVIGDLMLMVQDAWSQKEVRDQAANTQAEIGWVIAPAHSGQGLATEAARGTGRDLLRPVGAAPGDRAVLRRQRRLVAGDGEGRHAARGPRRTRVAAPQR